MDSKCMTNNSTMVRSPGAKNDSVVNTVFTNEQGLVNYREIAQYAMLIIHTILTQRGVVNENLVEDSEFNQLHFPRCRDPRHEAYLARVFTATKSALKSQLGVEIQLQIFSINDVNNVKEQWNITASGNLDDGHQVVQALIDEIVCSASYLPELDTSVFRICLRIDRKLRIPSQCARLNTVSNKLARTQPVTGGENIKFRELKSFSVQVFYK